MKPRPDPARPDPARLDPAMLAEPRLALVLDALEAGGHSAYLVGGAVRNALLGQPVQDVDIATDALPEEVVRLAASAGLKPVPTGIEHGTITVVARGQGFEVTTFRRDVETDGRRATVAFSDDLAEDAQRRDFTMNALYADRDGRIIDPVGGLPDLAARRLRFVGDPAARIHEDYLRILRFYRFLAWYGRDADPAASAACAALAGGLDRIARERIGAEMTRLLAAPDPVQALSLMEDGGVLAYVLPGADPGRVAALVAVERAENVAPDWPRRLAALSCDADLAAALRLSRPEARRQSRLAEAIGRGWSLDEAGYRLTPALATDVALLRAARGQALPPDWRARLAEAARATLPIAAGDLSAHLQGQALGRGLRAAEAAWIASGFAMPAPALIDTALLAGEGAA